MKAIIFDCFGVLTQEAWQAFVDSLPDSVDKHTIRETHRAYTAGIITQAESAARIKELAGKEFVELENMPPGQMQKNTQLLDYIRELRGRSLQIGLLSNIGSNWIRDSFLTPKEQELFDDMVFSYEVGLIKPDPRIFQLACERLHVDPSEAIMVDDIDRYLATAQDVGMQTVQYKDFVQAKTAIERILAPKQ